MNLDVDTTKDFGDAVGVVAKPAEPMTQEEGVAALHHTDQTKVLVGKMGVTKNPEAQQRAPSIATDERGILVGGSLEEQFRLATAYCQSGLMPRGFDTPQKVLVGIQLLRELRLPVIACMGKVMPLNGTAAIHSDLPLALVRRSRLLRSIKEEFIRGEKEELLGARCTVWRVGDEEPVTREFTVQDAKTAQLWNKSSRDGKPSPWVLYPQRMLQYRARSWALKDVFADVLFGVSILEYDHNAIVVDGQVVGVEEARESVADQLNKAYLIDDKTKTEGP
jgi:hypothetical protein